MSKSCLAPQALCQQQPANNSQIGAMMGKLIVIFALACISLANAGYPNPITDDEYVSVVTSSIDPVFYKIASEVGTDKVCTLHRLPDTGGTVACGFSEAIVSAAAARMSSDLDIRRCGTTATTSSTAAGWPRSAVSRCACWKLDSVRLLAKLPTWPRDLSPFRAQ